MFSIEDLKIKIDLKTKQNYYNIKERWWGYLLCYKLKIEGQTRILAAKKIVVNKSYFRLQSVGESVINSR